MVLFAAARDSRSSDGSVAVPNKRPIHSSRMKSPSRRCRVHSYVSFVVLLFCSLRIVGVSPNTNAIEIEIEIVNANAIGLRSHVCMPNRP